MEALIVLAAAFIPLAAILAFLAVRHFLPGKEFLSSAGLTDEGTHLNAQ